MLWKQQTLVGRLIRDIRRKAGEPAHQALALILLMAEHRVVLAVGDYNLRWLMRWLIHFCLRPIPGRLVADIAAIGAVRALTRPVSRPKPPPVSAS